MADPDDKAAYLMDPDFLLTLKKLEGTQVRLQRHAIDSLRQGQSEKAMELQRQADALRFCTGPYCPLPESQPTISKLRLLPVRVIRVPKTKPASTLPE